MKIPLIPTPDELDRLLAQPSLGCPTGLRNRVILETMHRAGLRNAEIRCLTPDDVRPGWLNIQESKNGVSRPVPIPPSLAPWLARWEEIRPDSPWYYCTLRGKQLTGQYLWQMMQREGEAAGLPKKILHPHALRHFYATQLARLGRPDREIQRLLGHASISTTMIYVHLRDEDLAEAVRGI